MWSWYKLPGLQLANSKTRGWVKYRQSSQVIRRWYSWPSPPNWSSHNWWAKKKKTSVVYPSNILQVLIIAPFTRHPTLIFTSIAKPSLAMGLARASDKEQLRGYCQFSWFSTSRLSSVLHIWIRRSSWSSWSRVCRDCCFSSWILYISSGSDALVRVGQVCVCACVCYGGKEDEGSSKMQGTQKIKTFPIVIRTKVTVLKYALVDYYLPNTLERNSSFFVHRYQQHSGYNSLHISLHK